jgi:type I restriction enzyme S subunit
MQLLQHFKELTINPKNAKELKGLILQLAIQGKLTANWREKNPNIIPANVLIKNILKDKERLIKQKKSKQKKQLSNVLEEEIPFELPKSWVWCRLGDITDLPYGKGLSKKDLTLEGYDVFGANGIIGKYSSYLYEDEQLLISCRGAYSGKTNISPKKCFVTSNSLVCDFFNKDLTYYKYFFYSITALPKNKIVTGSAQPQVTATNALPLPIALPPLEEQKEIVKVVETLFKEVELLEQLTVKRIGLKEDFVTSALNQLTTNNSNQELSFLQDHFKSFFNETANIKKLRETVLQLAVQGKLTADWRANNPDTEDASILLKRIQEEKAQLVKDKKIKKEKLLPAISKEEIPYELPEGWVWCRLQDVFKDLRYGTSKKCGYKLGANPVLRIPNLKQGGIDITDLKTTNLSEKELKDLSLTKGDLLIIRSNGSENLVGRSSVVTNVGLGYSFAGYLVRLQVFTGCIESSYLHTVLESAMIRTAIEGPLRTTSGVKNINSTEISRLIIPIPSGKEQKAIVQKVNALMALCDSLEQEVQQSLEQIAQLMQSCLREVFEPNNLN